MLPVSVIWRCWPCPVCCVDCQVKKDESAVDSVKKMIAAQRGEPGEEERKGQKEITLGEELEGPVRSVCLFFWGGGGKA